MKQVNDKYGYREDLKNKFMVQPEYLVKQRQKRQLMEKQLEAGQLVVERIGNPMIFEGSCMDEMKDRMVLERYNKYLIHHLITQTEDDFIIQKYQAFKQKQRPEP
jgi:hypothetical protein